ncbi:MAG: hypothetical protein ACREOZ_05195 [Gloeomargaritales cyanobacterium]
MSVILDWWTTEGNCARYSGGKENKGVNKTQEHLTIARLIKEAGISIERKEEEIRSKIHRMESSFKGASDWLSNTGQELFKAGALYVNT